MGTELLLALVVCGTIMFPGDDRFGCLFMLENWILWEEGASEKEEGSRGGFGDVHLQGEERGVRGRQSEEDDGDHAGADCEGEEGWPSQGLSKKRYNTWEVEYSN